LPPGPTAAPTPRPTGSSPRAAIPGFEGWAILNPASVAASAEDGTLVLALTRRALWFQAQRGVLVWKPVDGAFRITATVSVERTSQPSAPLDEGGTVRLGGLMARADGVRENHVFVVVGADANGLSVETKSTRNNDSRFDGPAWPAAAADLRLCRSGSTFTMLKRPAGSSDPWAVAATIDRPDLPSTLQVGPNLYTDGPPDVTARYEDLVRRAAGFRVELRRVAVRDAPDSPLTATNLAVPHRTTQDATSWARSHTDCIGTAAGGGAGWARIPWPAIATLGVEHERRSEQV
jgi:hypothetical protein